MRTILRFLSQLVTAILVVLLQVYRFLISPILHTIAPGGGCRFYPTCSDYALEAVRTHGPVRGIWLAIRRFSRCHPFGGHGFDPVPDACSCTGKTDHQHLSPFNESPPKETHPAGQ